MRSVEDRRAVFVIATARGRALEAEVSPMVEAIDARLRTSVSPDEWSAMENTLQRIGNFEDENRPARLAEPSET